MRRIPRIQGPENWRRRSPHGTLVVADRQTAGKGRRGKSWVSPAGTGIWMSMVLQAAHVSYERIHADSYRRTGSGQGVKESTGLEAMIKWPNDAVLNGKKICGILTEMSTEVECIRYVIPGIGINVNMDGFPEEIKATATSLKLEAGRSIKRSLVIAAVADNFEYYYGIFMKTCDMSGLRDDYNKSTCQSGQGGSGTGPQRPI
ncbi:MAG: biotin--[acetyl-CoA-carboxylase] ligase [Enterocloster clostridioformis]